jgi:N-acetylglucosaminyldiphosphoundecaprenol N-acetyl-beta-D-mannosaminyltransferase
VRKDLTAGLIGQRLIEAGYLTREQLQEALATQRKTAMLLGEVCILRGWLTYEQVRECLPNIRSRLGNRLLAEKRITMEQLWLAILEQRQTGERLGQILVARGWVDEEAVK